MRNLLGHNLIGCVNINNCHMDIGTPLLFLFPIIRQHATVKFQHLSLSQNCALKFPRANLLKGFINFMVYDFQFTSLDSQLLFFHIHLRRRTAGQSKNKELLISCKLPVASFSDLCKFISYIYKIQILGLLRAMGSHMRTYVNHFSLVFGFMQYDFL